MLSALRRHPVLVTAFALAAALMVWLLVEVASGLLGWHGRGPEPLAPWMTIGYVGRTHEIDPRLIDATAGFPTPDEAGHPLTLAEIAQRRGVPVEDVIAEVDRVLTELRPQRGRDDHGAHDGGSSTRGAGSAQENHATPEAAP